MARSPKKSASWLDKVYLVYFAIHVPIMLCVDLVPLYPQSLWVPPSSPLHFLHDLRAYYLTTYADQFFVAPPAVVPPFFKFFTFLELVFHLPVSVWAVRFLSGATGRKGKGGTTGPAELVLLVYGLETVLSTAACMYEAYCWDVALVTREQRVMLLGALYGSYLAIATVLTVDMYTRLLRRVSNPSAAPSAKKLQ